MKKLRGWLSLAILLGYTLCPVSSLAKEFQGELVVDISLNYSFVGSFKEGLARVSKDVGGSEWTKEGYINKQGEEAIPLIYTRVGDFKEGVAWVCKNNKFGYIDKTGSLIIPLIYDEAADFYDGLALVCKKDKLLLVDKQGKEINYLSNVSMSSNDQRQLKGLNKDTAYDEILVYENGLIRIRKQNKYGLLNSTGEEVTPIKYDWIEEFNEGIAVVKNEGKTGLIDDEGKEIMPFAYDHIGTFSEGVVPIEQQNKWGIMKITVKE